MYTLSQKGTMLVLKLTFYFILLTLYVAGLTAVHLAAIHSSMPCLRHLVRVNANVNLSDGKRGYAPLHHAVENEDLAMVGFLLLQVWLTLKGLTEQEKFGFE